MGKNIMKVIGVVSLLAVVAVGVVKISLWINDNIETVKNSICDTWDKFKEYMEKRSKRKVKIIRIEEHFEK